MALKSLTTSTDKSVRPLAVLVLNMFKQLALLERRVNEFVAQHQRPDPTDSYVVSTKAPDNTANGEGPPNRHSAGEHPSNEALKTNVLGRNINLEAVHNSSDNDRSNHEHAHSSEDHFHSQVDHKDSPIFLENGRQTELYSHRFAALNQAVNIAKQASDNENNEGTEKECENSSSGDHATKDRPVGTSPMNRKTVDLVTDQDNKNMYSRKAVNDVRQYHGVTSSVGKQEATVNETNLDANNWTEAVRKVDTRQHERATGHPKSDPMQIREGDRQYVSHLYRRSEQLSAESGGGSFAEGTFRPYTSRRGRPVPGHKGVSTQGEENSAAFRVESAGSQGQALHDPVSSYGSAVAGAAPRWGAKPGDANWFGRQEERSAGFKRTVRPGSEDTEVEPKKRKRVNWSQKDNERFMNLVLGNQHLAEVELRRLIACEFRNSRSHEQCANHLRILRSQQKLPPSKEDQERLQREQEDRE